MDVPLPTSISKVDLDFQAGNEDVQTCLTLPNKKFLTEKEEWDILQKLETSILECGTVHRLRRKLLLRRFKRNLGISLLELDSRIHRLLRRRRYTPVVFKSSCQSNDWHVDEHFLHSSTRVLDRYNVSLGLDGAAY